MTAFGEYSDLPRTHLYLEALARLALEVSRRPELLPLFLGVLSLVPWTVSMAQAAPANANGGKK